MESLIGCRSSFADVSTLRKWAAARRAHADNHASAVITRRLHLAPRLSMRRLAVATWPPVSIPQPVAATIMTASSCTVTRVREWVTQRSNVVPGATSGSSHRVEPRGQTTAGDENRRTRGKAGFGAGTSAGSKPASVSGANLPDAGTGESDLLIVDEISAVQIDGDPENDTAAIAVDLNCLDPRAGNQIWRTGLSGFNGWRSPDLRGAFMPTWHAVEHVTGAGNLGLYAARPRQVGGVVAGARLHRPLSHNYAPRACAGDCLAVGRAK